MNRLSIAADERGDAVILALEGELDLGSVEELGREVAARVDGSARRIVVDLRGLTFMDSSGLRYFLDAEELARRRGFELVLVRGADHVHQVFTITRTDERLRIVEDPETALEG